MDNRTMLKLASPAWARMLSAGKLGTKSIGRLKAGLPNVTRQVGTTPIGYGSTGIKVLPGFSGGVGNTAIRLNPASAIKSTDKRITAMQTSTVGNQPIFVDILHKLRNGRGYVMPRMNHEQPKGLMNGLLDLVGRGPANKWRKFVQSVQMNDTSGLRTPALPKANNGMAPYQKLGLPNSIQRNGYRYSDLKGQGNIMWHPDGRPRITDPDVL